MAMKNLSSTQGTVVPPAEPPEESAAITDTHEASEEQQENQLLAQLPAAPVHEPQMEQVVPTARQTRSGRMVKSTRRYEQSINQRDQCLVTWEVLLDKDNREDIPTAESQYAIRKAMENPMAVASTDKPDILYWDQAMKAHDRDKFIEAVCIELDGHEKMGNCEPIPLNEVPKGTKLLNMVWSMRRKRKIKTQEVSKWKAWLNVHGGQQEHGVHYWDTYAPVVTWKTVRLLLILSLVLGWKSHQLDFVMAYPQAPAEMPLHMRFAPGIQVRGDITQNTCPQIGAQRVWAKAGRSGMEQIY